MIRSCLKLAAAIALIPAMTPAQGLPDDIVHAEVIGGWRTADGTHMAALRITLADGWKTYWRAPGDAGIPPQFDWTGSENIADVRFHWPRPEVFHTNGMRSIGYSDELVLPIEIIPHENGEILAIAEIEMGVCQDICVPVSLRVATPLTGGDTPHPVIRKALTTVPRTDTSGKVTCAVDPLRDGLRLTATIALPPTGGDEVAVIEVADPSIWVSEAEMTRVGDQLTATVDLVPPTAKPFALDRSGVRITVLGDAQAVDLRGCTP